MLRFFPCVQVPREHSPVLLHPSLSQMSKALQGQSGAKPAQSGQSLDVLLNKSPNMLRFFAWVQVPREHSPVLLHLSLSQMSKALQGQSGAKPAQSGQSLDSLFKKAACNIRFACSLFGNRAAEETAAKRISKKMVESFILVLFWIS